jgi:hypothetical protein
LVLRLLAAPAPSDRVELALAIERLGLPALRVVRDAVQTSGAEVSGSTELRRLAARLAFIAEPVALEAPHYWVTAALKQRVDDLRCRPLEVEAIRVLLVTALHDLGEEQNGVTLTIEREGDDAGAEVVLTLAGRNAFSGDPHAGWDITERVRIDSHTVHASTTSSSPEQGRSPEQWTSLADVVARALQSAPDSYVSIRVAAVYAQRRDPGPAETR